MTLSAFALAVTGLGLTFMPAEIAMYLHMMPAMHYQLLLQLLGALYFSFAMLNWMAKGSIIGGIYNKPISLANSTHFFIGGMALVKYHLKNPGMPPSLWILTAIYIVFAVLFGIISFRHPLSPEPA